ncbi:MAG: molecular chaperone [Brevundimonas sp.]|nr:MAG: molecular chaperone [Brevundimonas sp.]
MQYLLLITMILVGGPAVGEAGVPQSAASQLEIAPVVLNLDPGQVSATIEVRNQGAAPVTIQARPYDWSQALDNDVLTPTSEIILSPPIFTVPANGVQTVRLMLRGDARSVADQERSYRLLLDEVPTAGAGSGQVQVTLRMSLPVFAGSAQPAPTLGWTAARSVDGDVVLTATNTGRGHVRVNDLQVTLADGSHPRLTAQGKSPYVLPGAGRRWVIEGSAVARDSPVSVRTTTQAGTSDVTLTF